MAARHGVSDVKQLSCLSREPGEWALERAKLNVNENFLLVGILEELEDVLLLLERFLPHYFKGVLSIYKDPGESTISPLPGRVEDKAF